MKIFYILYHLSSDVQINFSYFAYAEHKQKAVTYL